jgi:hypothetical protein
MSLRGDYKILQEGRGFKGTLKVELGGQMEDDLRNKIQDILLVVYTQVTFWTCYSRSNELS